MASIEERNNTNQFKGVEAKLDEVAEELKLQRSQLIGLTVMVCLLAVGLAVAAKALPKVTA